MACQKRVNRVNQAVRYLQQNERWRILEFMSKGAQEELGHVVWAIANDIDPEGNSDLDGNGLTVEDIVDRQISIAAKILSKPRV